MREKTVPIDTGGIKGQCGQLAQGDIQKEGNMTNRRNFLKAGLFSAMAAGLSHEAVAVPVKAPIKYDEAYDFVVIGAGNAGLSAAGYAAQAVLLEIRSFWANMCRL